MTRPASILAIAAVYFLVLSMILTLSPRLQAEVVNVSIDNIHSTPNISVFLSDSKPYNLAYGEWTARWWQWGYSIPKNINPAYDSTGKNCARGQSGSIWFLAGTYGHPVERVCTVPTCKAILFHILNSECSFAEFPKLKTLSELRMADILSTTGSQLSTVDRSGEYFTTFTTCYEDT